MANQDRTQLQATIAANLKDNTTGYITPARLREVQNNISDSMIYSAAAGIQQMLLLQTGDGLVKGEIIQGYPAWVSGSFSITENNLTEPTLLACDFLYVQAGGYIWGLQLPEPAEIPSGYTGEIAPKVRFTRIVDIETYEELAGHITLDETIYGDYAVIQNANPIAVEFGLTIGNFNGGSDAGIDTSPLLTLDDEGLLNFNTKRVAGIAEGLNPNDAVNWNQLSQAIGTIYSIYNQPTILSTPENPPYNLTSVVINNKSGNITAEVGDSVQFTLPLSGLIFNGEISEIHGPALRCSWTGYEGLPTDEAGTWGARSVTVDSVVYPSEEFFIATEYAPKFDGNGINQTGSLGNHLSLDRVAQMSFVLNSIYRICTKVLSQYASSGTDITVKLNRALTNNEGFETDVWYCYDTTSGVEVVPTITEGAADSYTLQFTSSANIKVVFRGENLPFVLPG